MRSGREEIGRLNAGTGEELRLKTKRLTELAMLTAVALIIFVVELQIPNPFPIPGVKLGLANIITVYAVYHYRPAEVMMIVFVRVFWALSVRRSYVYADLQPVWKYLLPGGDASSAQSDRREIYLAQQCLWGAVLHNIGQLTAAVLVTQTPGVFAYLPFLLVSGCLAGAFTGICAQLILKRLSGKNYS